MHTHFARLSKLALLTGTGVVALALVACSSPRAAGPNTDTAAVQQAKLSAVLPPYSGQQVGITVSGAGSVTAAPDVVYLDYGVQTQDTTVAPARAKAADAMTAVLASLKSNGVAEKDIQTTSFRIDPVYNYNDKTRPNQPIIVGYQVSNTARAKLRDLAKVGTAIDAAAAAGGDTIRINGISFGLDNPKALESQARDLAIKDAIAKAQQIAKGTGVKLGDPISLSESSYTPMTEKAVPAAMAGRAADSFAPTPINGGELGVSINIQVVFAIG